MMQRAIVLWFTWFGVWILSLATATPLWAGVCTKEPASSLPFCDPTQSLDHRVADYVQRIPPEAQISMMNNDAQGYEPLNIPPYQWWSEGLHGPKEPCVEYQGTCHCPTIFPCPSALGAAFNVTLYHLIGTAIGTEGHAISNLRPHDSNIGDGLTYWSPTINLQRDPRWGRNQEVPGEDPYLTGQYAKAFVKGLQGDDETVRVGAACKHFVANSLEQWGNVSRHDFDAHISTQDLFEYYFPPFRECAQHAVGVMCSYNAVNGVPACTNQWLLQNILRDEWKFDGYVVTDCGALVDVVVGHHAAIDPVQASAMALNASVDANCGDGRYYPEGLFKAYQEGWVSQDTVHESFTRLAKTQFRLGLFDSKEFHPEKDIEIVGSHDTLAYEAALQSIVLLQNRDHSLPLKPNQKLAVIGPHTHAALALLSNYHGSKCGCGDASDSWECIETPFQALSKKTNRPIRGVEGCHVSGTDLNEIEKATQAALEADAVVLVVGLDESQESEGLDRIESTLPGLQQELIQSILGVASDKTILVLIHGGSVSLGEHVLQNTPAILSAPYGGQAASHALSSVLFGEYNPTGKLAATMYPPSFVDELPMTEMGLRVGVGRTYMYYQGKPEFRFGHGLSYSQWHLEWAHDGRKFDFELMDTGQTIQVHINVTNRGPSAGSQNVLMFWRLQSSLNRRPTEKLVGFQGSSLLEVGETEILQFEIKLEDFALWNGVRGAMRVSAGTHQLEARGSVVQANRTIFFVDSSADTSTVAVEM